MSVNEGGRQSEFWHCFTLLSSTKHENLVFYYRFLNSQNGGTYAMCTSMLQMFKKKKSTSQDDPSPPLPSCVASK